LAGHACKIIGEIAAVSAEDIDMGILPDLVGFGLRCAQTAVFQHFGRAVAAHNVTPPQFGTLVLIEANPGISQSAVATALRFDRSTLVQIIDRLESRGLVVREASARDRRSHALKLTEDGAALLETLKRSVAQHENHITHDLSKDDKRVLLDLLHRVDRAGGG
jgi:DNA-binding MarR family transcriptional regulator